MSCENVLELLCASLDGTLTPAEEETLQAHLQACPRCRALQAELMGIHAACGELDVAVPAELKERILNALPAQKAAKSRHWQRWGAMAAALAIIAMAAWQLPHHLYQGESSDLLVAGDPTEEAAIEPRDEETTAQTTETNEFRGYDTQADDELPPYVNGEGVNVNAYVPSPAGPADTDMAAEAAVYSVAQDQIDLSAAKLYKGAQTTAPSDRAETGGVFADTGVAVYGDADGGVEPAAPSMGSRMATASTEDGIPAGGVDTAVPEIAPVMNEIEWSVTAEPLEPVVETEDEFAVYCGVLTLDAYQPEEEYPALLLENGDTWYTLPAQDFAELVQGLDEAGLAYELRLSGEDISPDAPDGLVIVPVAP